MELNSRDNSSDSELSDSWTILDSKSSEKNLKKVVKVINNNSSDASDIDSIEVVETSDQEGVIHGEADSDGISVISESDGGDNVETVPAVGELGKKKYVHYSNDRVNSLLSLLLAITVASVFGLGVGHYLGTQESLVALVDTTYLQLENQLLRSYVQDLLGENEWFRKILQGRTLLVDSLVKPLLHISNDVYTKNENVYDGENFFNQSLTYDVQYPNIHVYNALGMHSVDEHFSDKHTGFDSDIVPIDAYFSDKHTHFGSDIVEGNIIPKNHSKMKEPFQTITLDESVQGAINNYNASSGDFDSLAMDYVNVKNLPIYYSEEASDMPQQKDNSADNSRYSEQHGTASSSSTDKLLDEVKATVASGSELVTKLKHTLASLHSVFVEWNQRGSSQTDSYQSKLNSFGKKAFKEMEHIFADGGRTQKLLSKILSRLENFERNFPEKCDLNNVHFCNRKWCIDENDNVVKSKFKKYPNLVYCPQNEHHYYKSPSKVYNNFLNKEEGSLNIKNNKKCFKGDEDDDHILNKIPKFGPCRTKKNVDVNNIKNKNVGPEGVTSTHDKLQSNRNDSYRKKDKYHKSQMSKNNIKEEKNWNRKNSPEEKKKNKKTTDKFHNSNFQKQLFEKKRDKHFKGETLKISNKDDKSQDFKFSQNNSKGKDKLIHSIKMYVRPKHKTSIHFDKYKFKEGNYLHHRNKMNIIDDKNFRNNGLSSKISHSKITNNIQQNNGFSESALKMDDNWYKSKNISGDWLIKMNLAREKQRVNNHKSDWLFERAESRKAKRDEDGEKSRWYFMRARNREQCRLQPHSDLCKINEYKSDNEYHWKKDHSNHRDYNYHDYEHLSRSQRDWRSRRASKLRYQPKLISQAFLTGAKFMNA